MKYRIACLLMLLGLFGCAPHMPPPVPLEHAQVPADFPVAYYRQAEAAGRKVLRVDPVRSLVSIEVHRGGPLAGLGHDHVVASHDVNGYAAIDDGRADLYLPLDRLTVDEPALLAEAGIASKFSSAAVEGTRRNMLDKVLEADRYPYALIRVTRATVDRTTLSVTITLHGKEHAYEIPARIETLPGGILVSGRMSLNQTDFGIAPFAVLGGALQVQDRLDLRFRVLAGNP